MELDKALETIKEKDKFIENLNKDLDKLREQNLKLTKQINELREEISNSLDNVNKKDVVKIDFKKLIR